MPSLSLVTQSGAPNSSATTTLVEDETALAAGNTFTSQILQVQALPRLYFWFEASAGTSFTIQPQFAIRGDTANNPPTFTPDPDFLDLVGSSINAGVGAAPTLITVDFPAVWIRVRITNNGNAAGSFKSILAASV